MAKQKHGLWVVSGLLLGASIAFVMGFRQAQLDDLRSRIEHPDEYVCGLVFFAYVAVGFVYAIPGGLAGAIISR